MLIEIGNFRCDFRPWSPADGTVFTGPFALDVETPRIVAHEVPEYVLGAACDGRRGFFLPPALVIGAQKGFSRTFDTAGELVGGSPATIQAGRSRLTLPGAELPADP